MPEYDYTIVDMVLNKKFKVHWGRIFGGLGVGLVFGALVVWGFYLIP
jgi:hypothetical protein